MSTKQDNMEKQTKDAELDILLKLANTHDEKKLYSLICDYTKELVRGAGCSIFKVNPMTDKLEMVNSSNIPIGEWDNATYKRGEGKTGWVFKYGKFLYLINENTTEEVQRIRPKLTLRTDKKKPRETKGTNIGPFMAAPIKSEGYVIGVIRTPALPGKTEFTTSEQEIFMSFAARLSEVIVNNDLTEKRKRLINLYGRIGEATDIDKILKDIVKDITYVVGGGGCSVFLHEGDRDRHKKRIFVLKATTGDEEFQRHNPSYVEDGPGITAWVATEGKCVMVFDIDNPDELKKISPELKHKKGVCEIDDVGPFLAVPIKEGKQVIGVIRIPRRKKSKPFEEIDQRLLIAIADQLALVIATINKSKEINEIKDKRREKFKNKFSEKLIKACNNMSEIEYHDKIKDFMASADEYDDISGAILTTLESLWVDKYKQRYNYPLLNELKRYEEILFQLPGYRDHFIHQFQVFLLGSVIIDRLEQISKENHTRTYYQNYFDSLKTPDGGRDKSIANAAWLITSTFHDVGYPVQRCDDLFNLFFDSFVDLGARIVDRIGLEKIVADRNYGKLIDQLCDFYCSLKKQGNQWQYNPNATSIVSIDDDFRATLLKSLIERRDHGVLGALILLYKSAGTTDFSTVIYPSALAISLHKALLAEMNEQIRFETNPLAVLLIYCDLVQEWGRSSQHDLKTEVPELEDIDIYYDKDSIINVHIRMNFPGNQILTNDKKQEAVKVLGKLSSSEILFKLTIGGAETFCSHLIPK